MSQPHSNREQYHCSIGNKYFEKLMLIHGLLTENLNSSCDTDLELIKEIARIPRAKEYPTTAHIAQHVENFSTFTDQVPTSYYD